MGTKRFLAAPVSGLIAQLPGNGRVVDLFCGTGAVTAGLKDIASVVMNDASAFLGPLLRTRFSSDSRVAPHRLANALRPEFKIRRDQLEDEFADRLRSESKALKSGRLALNEYMESVAHVGNDDAMKTVSRLASRRTGRGKYCLMTIYFSGGYVSTRQAIALDALRCAIDRKLEESQEVDQTLAALTVTLDRVLNSPGHSAQFLRPNTETAFHRICAVWTRDVWTAFLNALSDLAPHGDPEWRFKNEYRQSDALDLVRDQSIQQLRAVYADPPYTKDQYSRYYHVYETLYLYDFPSSAGRGRYRDDRFSSSFSSLLDVEAAFRSLFSDTAARSVPVVLSYPPDGLLSRRGLDTADLVNEYFSEVHAMCFDTTHSTMGASKGRHSNRKVEHVYVCRP